MIRRPPRSTLFPYTTSSDLVQVFRRRTRRVASGDSCAGDEASDGRVAEDRKSTRLNSSHANLVCRLLLEKKKRQAQPPLVCSLSLLLDFYHCGVIGIVARVS